MIIYQNESITITKKQVFGKIGLSGHNNETGATVTAFVKNELEIPKKIISMIHELQKQTTINLTSRLERIEKTYLTTLK